MDLDQERYVDIVMKEYIVVPGPKNVVVSKGNSREAFNASSDLINSYAKMGWIYHSMESISVTENPGCFGSPISTRYYMLIFYRDDSKGKDSNKHTKTSSISDNVKTKSLYYDSKVTNENKHNNTEKNSSFNGFLNYLKNNMSFLKYIIAAIAIIFLLSILIGHFAHKNKYEGEGYESSNYQNYNNDNDESDDYYNNNDYDNYNDTDDNSDYDGEAIDLNSNPNQVLLGHIIKLDEGTYNLELNTSISFYGKDDYISSDTSIEARYANIVELDALSNHFNAYDNCTNNGDIYLSGDCYIYASELYIIPGSMYDDENNDLFEYYSSYNETEYIIPNSDSKLLTDEDVRNLSLQEINYAKNEIYARHGRIFKSSELSDYFNSKDWYYGTIDPDDFTDDMLSDIERKNAVFLKNIEYEMDPDGYKLDQ